MSLPVRVGVLLALLALAGLGNADEAPKVEVYSRKHAANGEENILNCFVSGFYPPQISITLLKNGQPMSDVKHADMSFNDKWHFQQLVYAPFLPQRGDTYSCRVEHSALPEPQTYRWDPDF
ncbi:beta-2-microglobulin [Melanerpes formicivorus]|uniref:beta-2-microglobulin n=1 Tax=Melanerpes formicivorus TaxID=211600 RepID=UPI00358F06D2